MGNGLTWFWSADLKGSEGRWERRGGWVGLVSRSLCFGRVIAFERSDCSAGCEGRGRRGGGAERDGVKVSTAFVI